VFGVVDLHAFEKELVRRNAALLQIGGQIVGQKGQVLDLLCPETSFSDCCQILSYLILPGCLASDY